MSGAHKPVVSADLLRITPPLNLAAGPPSLCYRACRWCLALSGVIVPPARAGLAGSGMPAHLSAAGRARGGDGRLLARTVRCTACAWLSPIGYENQRTTRGQQPRVA